MKFLPQLFALERDFWIIFDSIVLGIVSERTHGWMVMCSNSSRQDNVFSGIWMMMVVIWIPQRSVRMVVR
jgi:hypothetical protein